MPRNRQRSGINDSPRPEGRIVLRGGRLAGGTAEPPRPPNPSGFSGDLYIENGRIAALCPAGDTDTPSWEKGAYTDVDVSGVIRLL